MSDQNKIKINLKLREKLVEIAAKKGNAHPHIGSCLSCFDIVFETLLYQMASRDKFILSKGHAALALYVVLNHQKKITDKQLSSYLHDGGDLGIHPPSSMPDDIPLATGSLGHGLSFACGLAKAYLLLKKKPVDRVFCLISDGESNEGSIWEAALFASSSRLHNLTVIIDKNGWQAFGKTKKVLGDSASSAKWKAFGFNVYKCDGHNLNELQKTFLKIKKSKNDRPNAIICKTIRAKGIRSLENKLQSNYLPCPSKYHNED